MILEQRRERSKDRILPKPEHCCCNSAYFVTFVSHKRDGADTISLGHAVMAAVSDLYLFLLYANETAFFIECTFLGRTTS